MKIEKIIIGEQEFLPNAFKSGKFRSAISAKCKDLLNGNGADNNIANKGYDLLANLNEARDLTPQEQLTLACLEVKTEIRVISEGERDIPNHEELSRLSSEEMVNLILSTTTPEELESRISNLFDTILNDNIESEPEVLHTIEGTSLKIYKKIEDGENFYHIVGEKGTWGVTVDKNGDTIWELGDNDYFYCLVKNGDNTTIYHGSLKSGFSQQAIIEGMEPDKFAIIKEDFVCYTDKDLFIVQQLSSNEEVLVLTQNEISGAMESGDIVDIHTAHGKTLFIYKGFNHSGEISYVVVDDDNKEDCFYSSFPLQPIITVNSIYLALYSPILNQYGIADIDGILCGTIKAFIDEDDNYHINGNFPDNITNPNGVCAIRFLHFGENKDGEMEYDIGYIICGIESDKKEKPASGKPFFLQDSSSQSIH